MGNEYDTGKLKKSRIAFWLNLLICAISLIVMISSFDSNEYWRIVASVVGFIGFLTLTLLVFRRMINLEKEQKKVSQ
jgi:hypothetical protein